MTAKILAVVGTRPEVIKMAPVIGALAARKENFSVSVCAVAQQGEVLERALSDWDLVPARVIDVARSGRALAGTLGLMLKGLEAAIAELSPDMMLVHGDTSTTLAASLAAFYGGVRFAHVEAGLRTHDLSAPFPEEMHRVLVDRLASVHYAPTLRARENLLAEGCDDASIAVVGNPVVDALASVRRSVVVPETTRRRILVTMHRRESFAQGIGRICEALRAILASRDDVEIVFVLHPHPFAREPAQVRLAALENVRLLEPLDYREFVAVLESSYLVLTDSGGLQEEAPYLGKPVLVTRVRTEREESIESGATMLVGTDVDLIVSSVHRLLDDAAAYARMAQPREPFGPPGASERIARDLEERLHLRRCA